MDYRRQATSLQLELVVDYDLTHLAVGGEIDVANADDLAAAGEHALTVQGVSALVIDMAAVTFMSAAGVGALVSINNYAREHGQTTIVGKASRCVSRILELTALTDVFGLATSTNNRVD